MVRLKIFTPKLIDLKTALVDVKVNVALFKIGRATGTSQITGLSLVTTTTVNSVLTVRNPAGNAAALTVTPLAGGTRPVSAHLVITQLG